MGSKSYSDASPGIRQANLNKDLPPLSSDFKGYFNGKRTSLFTLKNHKDMQVAVINYGGRIVSWLAPDAEGSYDDIVLGFDSIGGYLNANEVYFGALIGRVGNRISRGEFTLNDSTYSLPTNDGPNTL